jgi:hypothetical protein
MPWAKDRGGTTFKAGTLLGGGGPPPGPDEGVPKMHTLVDDFPGAAPDPTKWTPANLSPPDRTITVVGGQLLMTSTIPGYAILNGVSAFDLTDSSFAVEVVAMADAGSTSMYVPTLTDAPEVAAATRYLSWYISWAWASAVWNDGGSDNTVYEGDFDPVASRWLRISDSGGTTKWSHSADGLTWVDDASVPTPIDLVGLYPNLQVNGPTVTFDHVNLTPAKRRARYQRR